MCHGFGDITTSSLLAAILNFRHEVVSAMIAGDLDVSYNVRIVINLYCFENDMRICKTSKVISTSGNLAAILDLEHVP